MSESLTRLRAYSWVFGEDRFVDEVLYKAGAQPQKKADIEAVLTAVERLYGIKVEELSKQGQDRRLSEARNLAAWGVKEMTSATLTELSRRIGRDVTTLSSGEKRLQMRAKSDSELAMKMVDFKGWGWNLQSCNPDPNGASLRFRCTTSVPVRDRFHFTSRRSQQLI
ncbi:MAG: hypothetical protein FD174_4098, partial [Geobacteraceae bacterium]